MYQVDKEKETQKLEIESERLQILISRDKEKIQQKKWQQEASKEALNRELNAQLHLYTMKQGQFQKKQ